MSAGARILVVDDDPAVRELVCDVLGAEGFQTEAAADSAEALRKIVHGRPDLVLLDLRMPGVDGWGLLGHLRSARETTPILVLSGEPDLDVAARAVRAGAAAFLSKPIHFAALAAACRRLLTPGAPPTGIQVAAHERRCSERLPLIAEVTVHRRAGPPGPPEPGMDAELVDLSASGAQVVLASALPLGTRVTLSLGPRVLGRRTERTAEVRWSRIVATGYAHGLVFAGALPGGEDPYGAAGGE